MIMNLFELIQDYPELRSLPYIALSVAKFKSASDKTINGSEPPNSKAPFFILSPHTFAVSLPPFVLPTNFTLHTLGSYITYVA